MDPLVLAAGTALVGAMATDAWQQASAATAALWHRLRPEHSDDIGAELETLRTGVLNARAQHDHNTEEALIGLWRLRLQQLLAEDPGAASEMRRLFQDHLVPALPTGEHRGVQSIVVRAEARDHAQVYIAGRDQHITGS